MPKRKRLIQGVHAYDHQVWQLMGLAHALGITDAGMRTHCLPYGANEWCELTIDDAAALAQSLEAVAAHDGITDIRWRGV